MNLFGPFFVDYIRFSAKKILELICSTRLSLIPGSATGCRLRDLPAQAFVAASSGISQ
jgi:hypothetical protein